MSAGESLESLFDQSVVFAFLRQRRFEAQIDDGMWWVDPQNGVARLHGRDRQPRSDELPIQVIGSEGGGEWLWGWANPVNMTAPAALDTSRYLQELGTTLGIGELTAPRMPVDALATPQTFAMIAVAKTRAAGYVLHRAGPLTVALVVDEPFHSEDDLDLVLVAKAVNEVTTTGMPFSNARTVLEGALDCLGIARDGDEDELRAANSRGQRMRVRFDGGRFKFQISS